eukprot:CAMPEP_0174266068 /NCGR_PEP_ID=MMETSP0439-20130205/28816_1 /TAXON_ID=0 /ORGANISM="Stereomyxa ramosa, Strain Chinc5" /LENGTH=393 /DNA_ID=CAMNT_0015352821 /DNA_START=206 /DNA_END=1384 /DNA_ORIENTATION=-
MFLIVLTQNTTQDFDMRNHVTEFFLEKGDTEELNQLLVKLLNAKFDYNKPLWDHFIINGFTGSLMDEKGKKPNGKCTLLFVTAHHALGDGTSMGYAVTLLFDKSTRGTKESEGTKEERAQLRPLSASSFTATSQAHSQYKIQTKKVNKNTSILHIIWTFFLFLFLFFISVPLKIFGMLVIPKKLLTEKPQKTKEIAWTKPVKLSLLKMIGKSMLENGKATINDILLTALTGAFIRAFHEEGIQITENLRIGIPVNLRPPSDKVLGNKIGTVWVFLPITEEDPLKRLKNVKRQMDTLKSSPESYFTYLFAQVLGSLPQTVAKPIGNLAKSRAHAVVTNVRGPIEKCTLLQSKLKHCLVFIPHTGYGGLGMGFISYAGSALLTIHRDSCGTMSPN